MRCYNFAKRSFKEIIRDPLSIIFAVILPLFLLFIFQQFNIPGEAYKIENFTPGIVVFGFSFITMFTAVLVAKDRSTSLLARLAISPMYSIEYVIGYLMSVLPIVLLQNVLFFTTAFILGLKFSIMAILTVAISLPISLLFIMLGVMIGSITSEKSSSGVSSIIVQLVAFTSGMYFDGEMVGEFFNIICKLMPFKGTVDILKSVLHGSFTDDIILSILTVVIYFILTSIGAIILFNINMQKSDKQ